MTTFHSIWTLLLLILFVAIVFWAWSGKRKSEFEEAARLPLDDDMTDDMPPVRHDLRSGSKTEMESNNG